MPSASARFAGSRSAIASLQLCGQPLAFLNQQRAGAASAIKRLADQVRGHSGGNALRDRGWHGDRSDPLPPGDLMGREVFTVYDIQLPTGTAQTAVASN